MMMVIIWSSLYHLLQILSCVTSSSSSFLGPTEQAFLYRPEQFSNRKQGYLRYRIRQKLRQNVAAQQRLDNSGALVGQVAERGFASYNDEQNNHENKSPRWDSNPRPKVSAPLLFEHHKTSEGLRNLRSASWATRAWGRWLFYLSHII